MFNLKKIFKEDNQIIGLSSLGLSKEKPINSNTVGNSLIAHITPTKNTANSNVKNNVDELQSTNPYISEIIPVFNLETKKLIG